MKTTRGDSSSSLSEEVQGHFLEKWEHFHAFDCLLLVHSWSVFSIRTDKCCLLLEKWHKLQK